MDRNSQTPRGPKIDDLSLHNFEKNNMISFFFRGFLAPLTIMQKSFSDGQGGIFFEKFKHVLSKRHSAVRSRMEHALKKWNGPEPTRLQAITA